MSATLLEWLREHMAPAPPRAQATQPPLTSPEHRFIAERRNEDAARIRLRMQARVQLLDAEAELLTRDDG